MKQQGEWKKILEEALAGKPDDNGGAGDVGVTTGTINRRRLCANP